MQWAEFRGKKVALLGAGRENLSLVKPLLDSGAVLTICEQDAQAVPVELERKVATRVGPDHLANLDDFDVVFRAPGLPVNRVNTALSGKAKQPVQTSATDLFLRHYGTQTIGVTGSKGKGTTSTMLGSIFQEAEIPTTVAGNIGRPIFDELERLTPKTVVVMELSSFQLEDIQHSPHGAIVLPISPDHLEPLSAQSPNYHETMTDYVGAKGAIARFQDRDDWVVYASDSEAAADVASASRGEKIAVSSGGNGSVKITDGILYLRPGEIIELKNIGLRGEHNFLDAALAAAAAQRLGVTGPQIAEGLKNFEPLPHRLETVATIGGVTFVDDSYATAPEATIAALSAFDGPIIWIAGGSSKGADFSSLAERARESLVKAVLLLGVEAPRLARELKDKNITAEVIEVQSLGEAVERARALSKSGDTVLLSPACASKDMFRDAADRGDQFKKLVAGIQDL